VIPYNLSSGSNGIAATTIVLPKVFRNKQRLLALSLRLMLPRALVNLVDMRRTAKASDVGRGCTTNGLTSTTVKAKSCIDNGCAAAQNIHVVIKQPSAFIAVAGPVIVNEGQPIAFTGFDQQVFVTFFSKWSTALTAWDRTGRSRHPAQGYSLSRQMAPFFNTCFCHSTPVTFTCIPPVSGCTNGLMLATDGDLSSPLGVVLLQTTQSQTQPSSFLIQVNTEFTLPATTITDNYATTLTIVVNTVEREDAQRWDGLMERASILP
jgi:hypothetical protein